MPSIPDPSAAPGVASPDKYPKAVKHSLMRKAIAQRMTESIHSIPQFTVSMECEVDRLLEVRRIFNVTAPRPVSLTHLLVRVTALALAEHRHINASWTDKEMIYHADVNISVAVSVPGGVVAPVLCHADAKPVGLIAEEIETLVAKARTGKLAPHEYQGGTFTLSNLGMFGVSRFTALVTPPQAAALAVGGPVQRLVPACRGHTTRTTIECTLSADHRVTDGAAAAAFLGSVKRYIEYPHVLVP